ncbi:MAG: DUF445 family protein [Deferrisomatales bacterium]
MDALSLLLPPVFGGVIGYVTNALAIAMLFRPHREVRVLGLRFQGMVPRRQAEIARSVAQVVASELLREESVAQRVAGPDVRGAVEALVRDLAGRYLDREFGPLAAELAPAQVEVAERTACHALVELSQVAARWAGSAEGLATLASALEDLLERTPAELAGDERPVLARAILARCAEAVQSPAFEVRVREVLARLLVRFAAAGEPLGKLLPPEVPAALLAAARAAVPALLRRFEEALLAPPNVEKLRVAVRAGIVAYLMEPRGGLVKNLVRQVALLGRERIYREADEIVDQNLHRLRELVHQEENRARLEEGLAEALGGLLRQTPAEVLHSLPPAALDALYERAAAELTRWLRRPDAPEVLAQVLDRELDRLFATPLKGLVEVAGAEAGAPERWARQLARWAADGGLVGAARREGPRLARAAARVPLGRPSRYAPPHLVQELLAHALDRLMPVVAAKVPEILRAVDVRRLIEREILAFSPAEVERVIQAVAHRELRAITWWGGVLGVLVGGVQAGVWFWASRP